MNGGAILAFIITPLIIAVLGFAAVLISKWYEGQRRE
jgi:hypothetical protein